MKKLTVFVCLLLVAAFGYAQNNDIFVFGGYYDQSRIEETASTSHSYDYAGGFFAEDFGSLAWETDSGTGYGILYSYTITDDSRLAVELGFEYFAVDLDTISNYTGSWYIPDGASGGYTSDPIVYAGELRNHMSQVNARYFLSNPEKNFRIYGVLGIGLNTIHVDASGVGFYPQNDFVFGGQTLYPMRVKADSFNAFTCNLGLGGDIKASDKFAFTFDFRYFYALNNETVIWHTQPGIYSDVTGTDTMEVGCEEDEEGNILGCENYNLAALYDSWYEYSVNYKPTFFRGVIGIKFMF